MGTQAKPPILIIGMHRSGTTLVTKLLEDLGLFTGKRKEENHESEFFLHLNHWLMTQAGGGWDHPEPVLDLLAHERVLSLATDYIQYQLRSPRVISYLGVGKYLRYRTPANLPDPWGWKDPRNTYTLPLWLRIFPDARFIHVYRHGVDVAKSLQSRHLRLLARSERRRWLLKAASTFRRKRGGFADSVHCNSLEYGLHLWEAYVQRAHRLVASYPDRACELRYESLLSNPAKELATLATFCELPTDDSMLANAARHVRPSRAYAYRDKPELTHLAEAFATPLRAMGYEEYR